MWQYLSYDKRPNGSAELEPLSGSVEFAADQYVYFGLQENVISKVISSDGHYSVCVNLIYPFFINNDFIKPTPTIEDLKI